MDAVLFKEVEDILGAEVVAKAVEDGVEWEAPYPKAKEEKAEVEVRIVGISASGCGIGLPVESESEENERRKHWAIVVPFALPGERVRARVFRHARLHSHADFVEMLEPNPELRDDSRVQCKYFAKCGGCQYQMVDYAQQLEWKADVVRNAYRRFSGLPSDAVPPVQTTIGSPLQYGYRTKITPHFDAPPKSVAKKYAGSELTAPESDKPDWLRIGFNQVNTRHVLDIEECPIAAPVLNQALPSIREGIAKYSLTYKKGVSLILRDSLTIPTPAVENGDAPVPAPTSKDDGPHVCITDFKATVRERVGPLLFDYNAGSFFQNNNSVLVPLTSYVRDAIFPPASASASPSTPAPTHLVDAYCGAGLFALSLAEKFEKVAGIELSADSIRSATHNATLNGLQDKCTFRAGDAVHIFEAVPDFPPHLTALVIDPPRKGCDESFINQMLQFGAGTVVYVSCNVHTQARDVGRILEGRVKRKDGDVEKEGKYVMESLRGFDLFPQTAHVEAVAVLRLVDA
ncbi:S-adenosyl-L-methionine-dependent methyltransferase [Peniophora sp. CONT]|nr:S-adenosyl-L-methionine-dependent methyltransferase [Peniophora sp. CONT]